MTRCAGPQGTGFACMVAGVQKPLDAGAPCVPSSLTPMTADSGTPSRRAPSASAAPDPPCSASEGCACE
jgi:hypothetical protein